IVFDAASWRSPEEPEEGGRVYEMAGKGRSLILRFGNNAVDFSRIRPGDLVWRTADPLLAQAAKPFIDPAAPAQRRKIKIEVRARAGAPVRTRWVLAGNPRVAVEVASAQMAET